MERDLSLSWKQESLAEIGIWPCTVSEMASHSPMADLLEPEADLLEPEPSRPMLTKNVFFLNCPGALRNSPNNIIRTC